MLSELTRREFLAATGAAVTSVGLGRLMPKSQPEQIVCGFIGTGAEGQMLLSNCLKIPGVKFAGICDIYPPHLNRALQMCGGGVKGYTDYRQLLDDKSIQAILIATPLHLHSPMSIDALDAGKTVFCEKCMALTPEAARAMCLAVERTGRWLQIGHQRNTNPLYIHARELLTKKNVLGKITHYRAWWHRNGSWRRDVPQEFEHLLNWRLYKETSAGLMAELGSHQVHLINWFSGEEPVSVSGYGGIDYWKDGRTTMDNVCCTFLYPEGKKLTYTSLTTNQYDGLGELFFGDKGTLLTDNEKGLFFKEPAAEDVSWAQFAHKEAVQGKQAIVLDATATKKKGTGAKEGGEGIAGSTKNDYLIELEHFFHDTVLLNQRPVCDHEVGFKTAVAILGANRAMETGVRMDFKPSDYQIHPTANHATEREEPTTPWARRMPK